MESGNALPTLVGGRYVLGSLLGRGGAAEVFRARDQLLDRPVAVKMFPATVAGPQSSRQRREINTVAQFHHAGLVAIYDAGEEDGRAFIVMQLVEGASLADRLRDGPLSLVATADLGAALADALAYVHRGGVVHRDVKPANVLIDHTDRPYLSDFGIATMADSTSLTATGTLVGTPSYLAPEQVRGDPVGPQADIYALGLVLLECLTGYREYIGQPTEAAVARLHRPPFIPPDLPGPMGALIHTMTVNDPHGRPLAAEVASRLRGLAAACGPAASTAAAALGSVATLGLPPGPRPTLFVPAPPELLSRPPLLPRRRPTVVLAATAAGLAVMILVALGLGSATTQQTTVAPSAPASAAPTAPSASAPVPADTNTASDSGSSDATDQLAPADAPEQPRNVRKGSPDNPKASKHSSKH